MAFERLSTILKLELFCKKKKMKADKTDKNPLCGSIRAVTSGA